MSSSGEAPDPRPSRLGRYELITRIGQGGMAEVQLALQRGPAGFEKLVVVKLVHEKLATEKAFVDMLLDEARVAAMVKHPNVVDIYDLGRAEGRYFIAMEYLEGEPLLSVLRAGREGKRLDPFSTARLIADTAEGLEAAHELRTLGGEPLGLVHHDVSLGNIVVLYNGAVKLVDFGVAKASQTAGPRVKVHGKFSYMAPEKLRGSAGDRRSDIFSLGVVAWESLTLRRLFKGGNDNETMKQVLDNPIPLPSTVNGDVHTDFDPVIAKATAKDPDLRYATAKEFGRDLEEILREHKYGGKNEKIADYMQTTFATHIVARQKLLQEVSSQGRASADLVEAAFDEPLATGSPISSGTNSGEFSVTFSRPSGLHATQQQPTTPDEGDRPRRVSQVLTTLPRPARNSGQMLAHYEPDVSVPGGGTTANVGKSRAILYVALGVGIAIAIAVTLWMKFGGTPTPSNPSDAEDEASSATTTPAGGAGSSGAIAGSAGTAEVHAGSASAGSADAGSADAGSADAGSASAGSADAGSAGPGSAGSGTGSASSGSANSGSTDAGVADSSSTGSASEPKPIPTPTTSKPPPPRVNPQELFKTGMQAFVQGDMRAAIVTFRRAVQAQPGFASAWRALGLAHDKLGEKAQAKTALQRYLQLAPKAADAAQIRERIGTL